MATLQQVIDGLIQEAAEIQIQGRALRPDEMARVQAIYEALPYLKKAKDILTAEFVSTLITYKIVSDVEGKLKKAARTACNFWNRFVIPNSSIVIRLGVFTANTQTIARAYKPFKRGEVVYGVVEFNTKYLAYFSDNDIAGTIIHEIGHTLGFGWDRWMELFDASGNFTQDAIAQVQELEEMRVETDYGPGTRYSHWDEETHDKELMTGIKDYSEYVLPVTIKIMRLLGHHVIEELDQQTNLSTLLGSLSQVIFSRQSEAKAIDRDHFESTDIWENVPHDKALGKKKGHKK